MQTSNDPLLRPNRLKHLTLKNCVMSTAHELTRLGVELRCDVWAEQDDVLALSPDIG